MKQIRFCLTFLFICLALVNFALADGLFRDGFGARVAGRGGTNIAFADNGAVLYDNPAAMVNMAANEINEFSLEGLITDLKYSDPDNSNGVSADHSPVPLGHASFIRSCGDGCFAYGLGVFSPAGFSSQYDMQGPAPLPGLRRYKTFGALGKIIPGVAWKATDRLSLGATLGVGISHLELEAPYFLQSAGALQGTPMMLDLQATGVALTWSLGMQYRLTESTTLGLAYQSQSDFNLDGPTRIRVPGVGFTELDTSVDISWPQSLGLGLKHDLCCHQTISVDVIWFDWSRAFDQLDMRFTNPSTAPFVPLIGAGLDEALPLNWRDSVSIRLGYEKHLDWCRTIRLGYIYHRNPIPDSTLTPYMQTILEHNFTIGYGQTFNQWEVDLAYQYTFGPDQNVGTSSFLGGDFNSSSNSAQAHAVFLTFLKRF